ncbi:MAG: hypothetical protein PHH58_09610 [Rhodoferax sp.]|nr:hypothetical protein [Rhodoferax sp.]
MACQTCHNRCGDCSEGGITFKRVLRPPVQVSQPPARTASEVLLSTEELLAHIEQGQEAQK